MVNPQLIAQKLMQRLLIAPSTLSACLASSCNEFGEAPIITNWVKQRISLNTIAAGLNFVCLNCSETVGSSSDQEWDLAGCEFIHSLECWKRKPKSIPGITRT